MSLELVDQGSLERPGPIGRLLRLTLGLLCLFGLFELIEVAAYFIERPIELLPNLILLILAPLCVFNYVVNIGFSKNWNSRPLMFVLALFLLTAAVGFLLTGDPESTALGLAISIWLGYFYGHLGISFVLAAVLATPGCEMRAIPELMGKLAKSEAKEHHCPSSIISGIDRWEHDRRKEG